VADRRLNFLVRFHKNGSPAPAGLGHLGRELSDESSGETAMQIEKHDKSYIVKLEDGSSWRIWPGDIALTLEWLPTTVLEVSEIDDEFCSHAIKQTVHECA
jgi:hypothetical protein